MSYKHIFFAILSVALWGINYPLTKFTLIQLPPFTILTVRMFIISLVFLPIVLKFPRADLSKILKLSITQYVFPFAAVTYALGQLGSGLVAVLTELEIPIAAFLGYLFFKEKVGPWQIAGTVLSFIGVLIISDSPEFNLKLVPIFMCIGSAVCFASYCVQIRSLSHHSPFHVTIWSAFMAAIFNLLCAIIFEKVSIAELRGVSLETYALVTYIGLTSVASYYLWAYILLRNPIHRVVSYAFLMPIFSGIAGYMMLGEIMSWLEIIGSGVILIGIILSQFFQPAEAKTAP